MCARLLRSSSLFAAGLSLFGCQTTSEADLEIIFLSVGQGDCIVIREGDHVALVDAGPSSDTYDAGDRLIAPKLRDLGIENVDLVLLSHPDSDHIGGLSGISKSRRIGKVVFPAHFQASRELLDELNEANVKASDRVAVHDGATITFGKSRFQIRIPEWQPGTSENEGSMFLRVERAGRGAVFTGDAGEETELTMASRGDWPAEILKAGHHGSRFSTSAAWLNRVKPGWVVASCGRANSYGHPASETLERIERAKAKAARTDLEGDIRFVLKSGQWQRVD